MCFFRGGPAVTLLAAGVLLLSSCEERDGRIWMFEAEALVGDGCNEQVVTHNFAEARVSEEAEEDWTTEDREAMSNALFFGELVEGPEGQGVLLISDMSYPGTLEGDTWTFSWTSSESTTYTESYLSDYRYEETTAEEQTTTITMTIAGDTASGTIETSSSLSKVWYESEQWGEEVGFDAGQIPSASYLVREDGEGGEVPATNGREDIDCLGSNCQLQTRIDCSTSRTFTATLTGWDPGYDYSGLAEAGQGEGV